MNFNGAAKRLDDIDLPRIGSMIGVGEDPIHAFLDVETSGSGFDKQGRPKMLFEPHVFYRLLGQGQKRDRAIKLGLAYAKWGSQPYPKDSYARLLLAMEIDEEIALQSASWGLGQVMGFNHLSAGYNSAKQMVVGFLDSEAAQLQGAVTFIKNEHLDDELRALNWAAFARGYNGAGYAANAYDKKLAAAYLKWSKIPDTAWNPAITMRVALDQPQVLPIAPVTRVEPVPVAEPAPTPAPKPVQRADLSELSAALPDKIVVALPDTPVVVEIKKPAPAPAWEDHAPPPGTVQTGGLGAFFRSIFGKKEA